MNSGSATIIYPKKYPLVFQKTHLSFWEICLDSLPVGRIERRDITAREASEMIAVARADQALRGVTQDDLLSPYSKQRKNHDALCAVLRDTYGIPISLEDFLCNFDDEGKLSQTIMALEFACLEAGERLMVVSCSYHTEPNTENVDRLALADDSVQFSLIEALG